MNRSAKPEVVNVFECSKSNDSVTRKKPICIDLAP